MKPASSAVLLAAAVLALAACAGEDESGEPTDDAGAVITDDASGSAHRGPVRLAEVRLPDGRRVVLGSFGGGTEVGACLTISGVDRYKRRCGRAPSERVPSQAWRPIIPEAWAQANPSAPLEIYGATSPEVVRVDVTYSVDGSSQQQPAVLMRISDSEALASAGIRKPFGYFLAELPPDASNITATAFDSNGGEVGGAIYNQSLSLHPRNFIAHTP